MTAREGIVSDTIDNLPDEILIQIFKYLPLETLLDCESVCSRWQKLVLDASIWRHILIVYSGKPGQSEVSEKNLEIISTHGEYIYQLKIQYVYSYRLVQSILDKCDNLISIELVMCRIGNEFENDVKRWQHLRKLNFKNSLLLDSSVDMLIHYDQLKELQYLSLCDFGLSYENCDTLLGCRYLSHILIEKIRDLNVDFIAQLILSKRNILETLHIYGGEAINDNCLKLLSECRSLKDLAIIRCENLSDVGLLCLSNLNNLEHLQIWNNNNFSESNLLKTLSCNNLVKLQSLSLSRIGNISPVIVDVISEYYKTLKFLALYQCPRIINTDYEKQLKSKFRNIEVVLY